MTIPAAAKRLGIPDSTAYKMTRATGQLCGIPTFRITATRLGVSRAAVEQFAAQNTVGKR